MIMRENTIGELDPETGEIAWQKEIGKDFYPLRIEITKSGGGGKNEVKRYFATWVDKNASANLAVLNEELYPIYTGFRSSVSARLSLLTVVESLEHTGPEGFHMSGSAIWDFGKGAKLADFPHLTRLGVDSKNGNIAPERIVLAGPPEDADETYDGTIERVVIYDVKKRKKQVDVLAEKNSDDYLALAGITEGNAVFYYSVGYYDVELICLGGRGNILWRQALGGQLISNFIYPFTPTLSDVVCAPSRDGKLFAYAAAYTEKPPEIIIRGMERGEYVAGASLAGAPGRCTSVEFAEGALVANFDYGKAAWRIDIATGIAIETEPREAPPEVRLPKTGGKSAEDESVESAAAKLNAEGRDTLLSNFGGRDALKGNFPSGMFRFGPPALTQDIAETGRVAVLGKVGEVAAGDELAPDYWQFYGDYRIAIAGDEFLFFSSTGGIIKRIKIGESK